MFEIIEIGINYFPPTMRLVLFFTFALVISILAVVSGNEDKLKSKSGILDIIVGVAFLMLLMSGIILIPYFQDAKLKEQKLEKIEKIDNNPSCLVKV